MGELASKKCVPCQGGIPPLAQEEAQKYLRMVSGWALMEDSSKIRKQFEFGSFADAMKFVNAVAGLTEAEGHHPEMLISFRKVVFTLYTNKIHGLHENDFILASKIDGLFAELH